MNMLSQTLGKVMSNPKSMWSVGQTMVLAFGAFHFTKIGAALTTSYFLGRFGKPSLIRETSKIHTSNYLMIPYMQMKKFIQMKVVTRTEENLLKGVILDKKLED